MSHQSLHVASLLHTSMHLHALLFGFPHGKLGPTKFEKNETVPKLLGRDLERLFDGYF